MKNLLFVCLGISIAAMAVEPARSQTAPAELAVNTLLSASLEGVEGTDVIVSRVQMPPNSELPKHWHPGEEIAYILEGSSILRMEGAEDTNFGPGEILKIPPNRVHSAHAGDEGATILVFRIHPQGEPERVLVD